MPSSSRHSAVDFARGSTASIDANLTRCGRSNHRWIEWTSEQEGGGRSVNSMKGWYGVENIGIRSSDLGDTVDRGCFGVALTKHPWMNKKQEKGDDHKNDVMVDSGTVDSTQNGPPFARRLEESFLVPQLPSRGDHLHLFVIQIHVGTGIDHEEEIPTTVDTHLFPRQGGNTFRSNERRCPYAAAAIAWPNSWNSVQTSRARKKCPVCSTGTFTPGI